MDGVTIAQNSLDTMSLVMDGIRDLARTRISTCSPGLVRGLKRLTQSRYFLKDYLYSYSKEADYVTDVQLYVRFTPYYWEAALN